MTNPRIFAGVTGGLVLLGGCAGLGPAQAPPGLTLVIEGPVTIPAGRAHATFQGGRQVSGRNRFEPWCELEVRSVAQAPTPLTVGDLPVLGVRQAFIRDYNTRAPALLGTLSCSDLVFQETVWGLASGRQSPVLWLRCLAPYTNCRFGPPLSPAEIDAVVGPSLRVEYR